jgi:hypothetical protein
VSVPFRTGLVGRSGPKKYAHLVFLRYAHREGLVGNVFYRLIRESVTDLSGGRSIS